MGEKKKHPGYFAGCVWIIDCVFAAGTNVIVLLIATAISAVAGYVTGKKTEKALLETHKRPV